MFLVQSCVVASLERNKVRRYLFEFDTKMKSNVHFAAEIDVFEHTPCKRNIIVIVNLSFD
jgi:hypothetical protein